MENMSVVKLCKDVVLRIQPRSAHLLVDRILQKAVSLPGSFLLVNFTEKIAPLVWGSHPEE
jgi:hypothetical protein